MEVKSFDHPLVLDAITDIRNKETTTEIFRERLSLVTQFLCFEASRDLELETKEIETPMQSMKTAPVLKRNIILCSIMRAGNGMLEPAMKIFTNVKGCHLGLERQKNLEIREYYSSLPDSLEGMIVFLLDPMLASGNSSFAAITKIAERNPLEIRFINLISVKKGIEKIARIEKVPIKLFTGVIDPEMNEKSYILPGLGDAGDRLYGI